MSARLEPQTDCKTVPLQSSSRARTARAASRSASPPFCALVPRWDGSENCAKHETPNKSMSHARTPGSCLVHRQVDGGASEGHQRLRQLQHAEPLWIELEAKRTCVLAYLRNFHDLVQLQRVTHRKREKERNNVCTAHEQTLLPHLMHRHERAPAGNPAAGAVSRARGTSSARRSAKREPFHHTCVPVPMPEYRYTARTSCLTRAANFTWRCAANQYRGRSSRRTRLKCGLPSCPFEICTTV